VKLFLLTTKLSIHYLIVAYFSVSKEQMYDRFNFERERNIWPTIILKLKKNKQRYKLKEQFREFELYCYDW
jgi:hypothetical protein